MVANNTKAIFIQLLLWQFSFKISKAALPQLLINHLNTMEQEGKEGFPVQRKKGRNRPLLTWPECQGSSSGSKKLAAQLGRVHGVE